MLHQFNISIILLIPEVLARLQKINILTNLSSLGVWGQEVDHLDASYENLLLDRHLNEVGSLSMNSREVFSGNGATFINGLT